MHKRELEEQLQSVSESIKDLEKRDESDGLTQEEEVHLDRLYKARTGLEMQIKSM